MHVMEGTMLRPVYLLRIRSIAGLGIALLLVGMLSLKAQTMTTVVSGVVKDTSGKPVEGALVRFRSVERGFTFMVVSQAQGRYTSPKLHPGKYMIDGVGGNYQSSPAGPLEIGRGQPAKTDVILSVARK